MVSTEIEQYVQLEGFICTYCGLSFAGLAIEVSRCPLCNSALRSTGVVGPGVSSPVRRHDRRIFERALYSSLARVDQSDHLLLSWRIPKKFRPIHVPMRRIQGRVRARQSVQITDDVNRRYEADVCLGAGMPEALKSALEMAPVTGSLQDSVPDGEIRLDCCTPEMKVDRAAQQLLRRIDVDVADGFVAEPAPDIDFYRPIWWCKFTGFGRSLEIAVDAVTGHVLFEHWQSGLPRAWFREMERWVPALLLAVVSLFVVRHYGDFFGWVISDIQIPLLIIALIAGWSLISGRQDVERLRNAAAGGDLVGLVTVRAGIRRRGRWLARLLFLVGFVSIAAGICSLARAILRDDPLAFIPVAERGVDFEDIRPWRSINLNFLLAPYAVNGRVFIITTPAPLIGPTPSKGLKMPTFGRGTTRFVGAGGFETLAEAIENSASGDRILVRSGSHPGGRAVVYHDLLIEGEKGAVIEWHDSRGPFIRIGGTDTTLVVRHLQFDTRNTNSNLIGDPNMAYGETPVGIRPHVVLEDIVSMPTIHVINLWSPGGTIEVHGGRYGGITGGNLERVAVLPLTLPDGSVELTYLVGTPIGAGGIATYTCVICIGNVNAVEIDGLRSEWDGDVRLGGSILRARIGANVEGVRVQLTDDFMHESGTLPLPPGRALDFRIAHGVIDY